MYKIITLKANAKKIVTWKCIWCQICNKIVTWKAYTKDIVTLKCIWHHICAKQLLCRQMLREIVTWTCIWHQICTNRYFKGKCWKNHHFTMHLTPNMYKIITLKANAKEIVTLKCVWHQICTKSLLWRQMLRKSSLEVAFDTNYVQNHYFKGKC